MTEPGTLLPQYRATVYEPKKQPPWPVDPCEAGARMPVIFLLPCFWLPVMVVVGYLLFLLVWLTVLGRLKSRWRRPLVFLSVPAYILLLVLLHMALAGRFTPASTSFRDAMGFDPPADVSNLRSYRDGFLDFEKIYLRFKAAPSTVERILATRQNPMSEHVPSPGWEQEDTPPAFRPPPTAKQYWVKHERGRTFGIETELLAHDAATGEVYYRWVGID